MSLKIIHIELGRHLYGGAKQVVYLLNELSPRYSHQNHLICVANSDISKQSIPGCVIHPIPCLGDIDFFVVKRILNIIKKVDPDILHIHSRRGADVWGAIVAKITKIPTICTRRVDNTESKLASIKYKQFAAVVSISKGVHDVVRRWCEPEQPHPIIYSSVNLHEFSQPANRAWLNKMYSIPENHMVIANFAQLITRKGQADLINAMPNILKNTPKVTCLLFGQGKLKASYQQLIDKHNLTDNVKLCGFSTQVEQILPCIDVLIHPAYAEGLGVILLQAGACKVPVVSTPVGGIPEIIKHDKTGLMIESGQVGQISLAVGRLMDNSELRLTLANALYQHVKEVFSTTNMANKYNELYEEIAGS